ncbi:hypothetical protein VDIAB_100495 [Vibrio diabolicus]|nr:hypothetical protein VDIAB_100495 [Vibrio diabolicus]
MAWTLIIPSSRGDKRFGDLNKTDFRKGNSDANSSIYVYPR